MSIASSPPLDLDPAEDLTAEDVILHSTEFTKVKAIIIFDNNEIEINPMIYSKSMLRILLTALCEGDKEAETKTWSRGSRKK